MQPSLKAARTALLWRIHWWAALVSTPFTLIATLTGILYIFTPQVEQILYGRLERVAPAAKVRPLDEMVAAAQRWAPPGMTAQSVVAPALAGESVKVAFVPQDGAAAGHQHHGGGHVAAPARKPSFGTSADAVTVFVDPANATVLGTLANAERFSNWAKRLHSRLLQGEGWRWMIELAASWMLVMLVTGICLWWPTASIPRAGLSGRAAWRQWHAFLGVALGVVSLAILLTGLTWSKYAGDQVRTLRDAAGQAGPQIPRGLVSHPVAGQQPLSWQAVLEEARSIAPAASLQLTPPRAPSGMWRVAVADRDQPWRRLDLAIDAYSGAVLYQSGWDQQTLFGKATGVGIPFHRGELGWWNQAVLLLFGLGLLFSLVSGWVMYFKRKRPGALALPVVPQGAWRAFGPGWWLAGAAFAWLMPLLALSAPGVLLADRWLARSPK